MIDKSVAEAIEGIFKSERRFILEYSGNSHKVFSKLVKHLKVVPYDLKHRLDDIHKQLTTTESDDFVA
jgi:pyruvate-formate lyase-activating enzyme